MRALTVRRPWAGAIALGIKPLENRSWKPPNRLIGCRIAIHAGMTYDHDGARWIHDSGLWEPPGAATSPTGIVCVATLTGIVTVSDDPWFCEGSYGWLLTDIVAIDKPISARGSLGLWRLQADLSDRLGAL